VDRNFVLMPSYSVDDRRLRREPAQTFRSGPAVAVALTKEAFWMTVLLSSLGLWAAIWAVAGSLVSAWLR
jgi:hypothetical protein